MSRNDGRLSIGKYAVTMVELIVVLITIGILTSISVPQYLKMAEKGRASEAYLVFKQFREGFLARKAEGECIENACGWNPRIAVATNTAWRQIYMENPNADTHRHFAYGYCDTATCTNPPVSPSSSHVITASRRRAYVAYTTNADTNKYLYMDLDTGKVVKSYPY